MPGTIQQELKRILLKKRAGGETLVWLSEENLKALGTRPGTFAHQTTPPAPLKTAPPAIAQPASPVQPQISTSMQPDTQARLTAIQKASWEELKSLSASCGICGFCHECGHRFFAWGPPSARLLFVGDFPTQEEDETGTSFAGNAGVMVYKMGTAMGFSWQGNDRRKAVALVNLFKCRPHSPYTEQHIQACLPILKRQIELIAPDALVLMGALPLKCLNIQGSFSALKGSWTSYLGIPAVVIQSPSVILRFASMPEAFANERRQAWNTLQELMKYLQV